MYPENVRRVYAKPGPCALDFIDYVPPQIHTVRPIHTLDRVTR